MKTLVKYSLSLLVFGFVAAALYAQGTPNQDPDLQVPVDGGIFSVVGGAIAYGMFKAKKVKKDN